jgi:uncharacterized membrane protein
MIIGLLYPLVLLVPLILVAVIIMVLVQVFSSYGAKTNTAHDETPKVEQKAADEQKKISGTLEDMRTRLTHIEKILHDVE